MSSADVLPRPAAEPAGPPPAALVIEPPSRLPGLGLRELWAYRELFFFLVWRDVKVRYAQTVLGAGWAILQPVLTMVVFTVIFGNFAKVPSDGVPYPVFSLAALVPWTYFNKALTGSSASLVTSKNLITKVYFPRLVVPLAPVLAALVDLAIGLVILLIVMLAFGIVPPLSAAPLIPVLVLAAMATAAGVGCWLAALNIQYRDVKYVVPFLIQIWMYGSPVVYGLSLVPEHYRPFYVLNPMVGVIEGFRAVLLGTTPLSPALVAISLGGGFALLLSGALFFRRTENVFADVA